jgi:hypothetical protein
VTGDGAPAPGPTDRARWPAAVALGVVLLLALGVVGWYWIAHRGPNRSVVRAEVQANLDALQRDIAVLTAQAQSGQPLDGATLNRVSTAAAAINVAIEDSGSALQGDAVHTYLNVALGASTLLTRAKAAPGAEAALTLARVEAGQGFRTAALYFGKHPDQNATGGTPAPAATEPGA